MKKLSRHPQSLSLAWHDYSAGCFEAAVAKEEHVARLFFDDTHSDEHSEDVCLVGFSRKSPRCSRMKCMGNICHQRVAECVA